MTPAESVSRRMSRSQQWLLILLVASVFINYMDRGNLSIAAPLIRKELALSPLQMGSLLSAFFWSYSLLQLFGFSGWLADYFPVGRVFAIGFLIWSAATFATGLLSTFAAIYAMRLVVGAGESIAYPCYSRMFASDLPEHHRGRANALIDAGSKMGSAVGAFIGGRILEPLGWRVFFMAFGVGSLLWLIPWLLFRDAWKPRSYAAASPKARQLPSIFQIFRFRSAWGTFAGQFCGNYFWYFLLTWLPTYLVKERNFSIGRMANVTSAGFVAMAGATVLSGWMSDHWVARGVSPTRVRKMLAASGLAGSSILLPVAFVSSATTCVVLLVAACMAFGVYTSNTWPITQTLSGPLMAGRWTSLQNGIANMSGVVAPLVAGFAVDTTGSSKAAFVVSGVVAVTGALMWGVVIGPLKEVSWTTNLPSQVKKE